MGDATITVSGTAAGVANQTATVTVAVTTPSTGGGVSGRLRFCSETGVTTFVAAQDGTGTWHRVTIAADSTYPVPFASGRGVVAFFASTPASTATLVYYASAAELRTIASGRCINAGHLGAGTLVRGAVASLGAGDVVDVSAGPAVARVGNPFATPGTPPPDPTFQLRLPGTPVDLVGGRSAPEAPSGPYTLTSIFVRRGISPPGGSTLPPLDFAAEGFAPEPTALTVTNVGSDVVTLLSLFTTARGTAALLGAGSPLGRAPGAAPATFPAIPANRLVAGDLQGLQVSAVNLAEPGNIRSVSQFFTAPGARTLA